MARVYAGSDGSYISGWQMWKRRNESYERLVIAHEDIVVFQNTDDNPDQEVGVSGYITLSCLHLYVTPPTGFLERLAATI